MDYASFVYFPNAKGNTSNEQARICSNEAIKLAFCLRMSSPNNVALAEAGIPYVKDRAAFLGKSHIVKIIFNRNHGSVSYIKEFSRTLGSVEAINYNGFPKVFQECVNYVLMIHDLCRKDDNFACLTANWRDIISPVECDTNIGAILQYAQIPDRDFGKLVNNKYHNFVHIYTDGSKIEGGLSTGAAIVCQEMNHKSSISMNANASVFTAKCITISETMNLVLLNYNKSYLICLDSLSAIMYLNNLNINVKTNKYIIEIK